VVNEQPRGGLGDGEWPDLDSGRVGWPLQVGCAEHLFDGDDDGGGREQRKAAPSRAASSLSFLDPPRFKTCLEAPIRKPTPAGATWIFFLFSFPNIYW